MPAHLGDVGWVAMAGDDIESTECFELLPAFQPTGGVGIIKDRRHPLMKCHVAGKHQFLLGEEFGDQVSSVLGVEIQEHVPGLVNDLERDLVVIGDLADFCRHIGHYVIS